MLSRAPAAILSADLVYVEHRLEPDIGVAVDADGVIVAVGPIDSLPAAPIRHFRHRALFPGFVNTHSHAFQRLIRGRTLTVPAHDARADFWSWRTRMYEAALALEPQDVGAVTAYCYLEMLQAGITSVVEFHYLHHAPDGRPYADPNTLAWQVIDAARRVGIRLTLLPVAYHRGGFGRPADPAQRRFLSPDVDTFLTRIDALRGPLTGRPGARLGLAAHSVRAVPEPWLDELKAYARAYGLPVHVHANEQQAEVEQCVAATGRRPVELLADRGFLDARTTVVHATHLSGTEKALLAGTGARVSVCPTTERDLGDGILDATGLHARGVPLCLGSDSQVQIDFFAEMRCLEGHERLRRQRRNVLIARGEGERSVAPAVWEAATRAGADAAGLPVGAFVPGSMADAVTVNLNHPELDGGLPRDIPGLLLCAGGPHSVSEVLVGGRPVRGPEGHPLEGEIRGAYRALCRRLWG
jgi:formimidoylglutamate deiminase